VLGVGLRASVRSEGQVKSVASTLVSIDGWLNSQIRAPPMYSFERHQKPLNRAVGKRKDQRASLLDCDCEVEFWWRTKEKKCVNVLRGAMQCRTQMRC